MPIQKFPTPQKYLGVVQDLGLGGVKAFGYPWHGKWEQVAQGNGQYKDVLTLVTDTGEEAPAPVFTDGTTIPKLTTRAHTIDVQMPWASDPAQTPEVIATLGGKYWNQALFAPGNPAYLYGKNIGAGDALYGAPDGSIWAYRLTVPGGTWVPGLGQQGALTLYMRQVAGEFLRQNISVSNWINVPLVGAPSLATLFPDIVAEIPTISISLTFTGFSTVRTALNSGGSGIPILKFQDALPDGSRALYAIRVPGASTSGSSFGSIDMSVIVALLEVSISGNPGSFVAEVQATHSPGELLNVGRDVDAENGSLGTTFHIDSTQSLTNTPATWSAEVAIHPGNEASAVFRTEVAEISYPLLAGYVGNQIVYKSISYSYYGHIEYTPETPDLPSDTLTLSGEGAVSTTLEVSSTVEVSAQVDMVAMFEGESLAEAHYSSSTSLTRQDSVTLTLTGRWSEFQNKYLYSASSESTLSPAVTGSLPPFAIDVGFATFQLNDFPEATFTASIIPGAAFRTSCSTFGGSWAVPVANRFSVFNSDGTQMTSVQNTTATQTKMVLSCAVITPQVLRVAYGYLGHENTDTFYDDRVLTFGNARSETNPTPLGTAPVKYISWCPVRDKLLVTTRSSSWV
jgi:hypothetical protein